MSGYGFLNYPEEEPSYSDNYQGWIWKQDPSGNTLWAKNLIPDFANSCYLGADISGNIYITGAFYASIALGTFTITSTGWGRYVAKLDSQGEWLWAREINGIAQAAFGEFAVGLDGSCFFTGSAHDSLNFDGITLECSGYDDMFIARMNNQGTWVWARMASSGWRAMEGWYIAPGLSGECYVAGKSASQANFGEIIADDGDYFIASYGSTGICLEVEIIDEWWIQYEGDYHLKDLVRTPAGQVLLLYEYEETGTDAHRSVRVARCFTNASIPPDEIFVSGYSGYASGLSLATDSFSNIYVLGSYTGPYTFYMTSISLTANRGTMLLKLNSQGDLLWASDPSPGDYSNYNKLQVSQTGQIYLLLTTRETYPVGQYQTSPGILNYNTAGTNSAGTVQWLRSSWNGHIGSNGKDIVQSPDGDVFLCGDYRGDFIRDGINHPSSNPQSNDVYIARMGQGGPWEWINTAGGTGDDRAEALYLDSAQNVYLTGYFEASMICGGTTLVSAGGKDIFAAKLDNAGNWLWAVSWGGLGDDLGRDVLCDAAGNIYLCGSFSGTIGVGSQTLTALGGKDGLVIKLDPQGAAWAVTSGGGPGNDQFSGLTLKPDGEVAVCGSFEGTSTFGGEQLVSCGEADILAGRLTPQLDWTHCWNAGGVGADEAMDIGCDSAGNLYLTGIFTGAMSIAQSELDYWGANDIFLAKTDPLGNWSWSLSCGSYGTDLSSAIAVTPAGEAYLTGYARGDLYYGSSVQDNHCQQDILTTAASAQGHWLWAKLNGPNEEQDEDYSNCLPAGAGIALHSGGYCIVTGTFSGCCYLTTENFPHGAYDTFVGVLQDGVQTTDPVAPELTGLNLCAWPSPFTDRMKVSLDLPKQGQVSLKVYNLRGELVRTLISVGLGKGNHQLDWDGCDSSHAPCSSGIYLLKASSGPLQKTLRVVKL